MGVSEAQSHSTDVVVIINRSQVFHSRFQGQCLEGWGSPAPQEHVAWGTCQCLPPLPSCPCPAAVCLSRLPSGCPLGTGFRGHWVPTVSITAKPCKPHRREREAGGHSWGHGGVGLCWGGDLDKDTLAFGAKERWETWQDRGINRDANKQGAEAPGERGRGMSGSQGGL